MSLEWVWRFSKSAPNSYVFIFLLFTLFGQEEWVWSKFGDSPNWLQIRSKLVCFHIFSILLFFGKEEWVWSEFGDSPKSLQTRSKLKRFHVLLCFPLSFHVCLEKTNDFGVSLGVLQTLSKLTPNSLQTFLVLFYLFYFLGKRGMSLEWVWGFSKLTTNSNHFYFVLCVFPLLLTQTFFWEERNENGVSLKVLQTFSKLTPNSLQTHMVSFCCFLLFCQLIVFLFFEKGITSHSFRYLYWIFFKKKEWIWRFPKVSPISLRALVATPLGPEITYSGRCFIGTYQIDLVHAYHPEQLSSCKLSIYI